MLIEPLRRASVGKWFNRIQDQLVGCDIVFADPDNGLVPNDLCSAIKKIAYRWIDFLRITTSNPKRPGAPVLSSFVFFETTGAILPARITGTYLAAAGRGDVAT